MEKRKMLRRPRDGQPADRLCSNCGATMFNNDWPMQTIGLLLYAPHCYNCGAALDWKNPITIGGDE